MLKALSLLEMANKTAIIMNGVRYEKIIISLYCRNLFIESVKLINPYPANKYKKLLKMNVHLTGKTAA
jgi:hypothetical protein